MALPNKVDPSQPLGSSSRSLGDDQIRALKQAIIDIFGLPSNQDISNAVFLIDTDGDITAIRLEGQVIKATYINATDLSNALHFLNLKGTRPGLRLIGNEVNGRDFRFIEQEGVVYIEENTNTEASPTWSRRVILDSSGNIQFFSGQDYPLTLNHTITGHRTVTFPDGTDTVVMAGISQTIDSKIITNASITGSQVTDRLVLASAAGGTPEIDALYSESRLTAWAVFNGASASLVCDGLAKFNISGNPADNGTGDYTITLSRAFTFASPPVFGIAGQNNGAFRMLQLYQADALGSRRVLVMDQNGAAVDAEYVSIGFGGGHQG